MAQQAAAQLVRTAGLCVPGLQPAHGRAMPANTEASDTPYVIDWPRLASFLIQRLDGSTSSTDSSHLRFSVQSGSSGQELARHGRGRAAPPDGRRQQAAPSPIGPFNRVMRIDFSLVIDCSVFRDLDNGSHRRFITHRKLELGIPTGLI